MIRQQTSQDLVGERVLSRREARAPDHYLGRDGLEAAEQVCSAAVRGDTLHIVA